MRAAIAVACCVAFILTLSPAAVSQRGPVPPNDPGVQAGVADATAIITNINVSPGQPGWVDRLARKIQMSMCLRNFQKMLKDGKVIVNDPRVRGAQAATTPESSQDGQSVRTTGVGVGNEEILLGPDIKPPMHPLEMGQKFMHEGARVKQASAITNATLLPGNQGPGPDAPPGERCKWLRHEFEVYDTDADYYAEAAQQAQAQGAPANTVQAINNAAQMRRNKADSIKKEIDQEDC